MFITSAFFKAGPNRPWIKVLDRAGPAEIFVPYARGQPRYRDLALGFNLANAMPSDTGPCGLIVGEKQAVIREVADKGVLWKLPKGGDGHYRTLRGHKVTLWGTLDAENYLYLLSYSFHDDGSIEFRAGATGSNLPNMQSVSHVHSVIWRIRPDFNRSRSHNISLMRHAESETAEVWPRDHHMEPLKVERPIQLVPRDFTTLHIEGGNLRNSNNASSGYMLMPHYRGVARHIENWMKNDISVTRHKELETDIALIRSYLNGESLENADVAIWVTTSALHIPRDEDGRIVTGQQVVWNGSTPVMWVGFDMKPHNLFAGTPFLSAR